MIPSVATSSISRLTRQLEKIEAIPKSDVTDAQQAVDWLLAQYGGQKAADPDKYYKLMVSACTGVDLDILQALAHPTQGIKGKFLPSVGEVVDFLHERLQRRQEGYERAQRELQQLTHIEGPEDSPEAKAAALARWEATRKHLKLKTMDEGEGQQQVSGEIAPDAAPNTE